MSWIPSLLTSFSFKAASAVNLGKDLTQMSCVFRSVHGSTSVSCEAMLLDQMRILSNESGNMLIKATTKKTSPKIKQNFVYLQLVNLFIYCKWKD